MEIKKWEKKRWKELERGSIVNEKVMVGLGSKTLQCQSVKYKLQKLHVNLSDFYSPIIFYHFYQIYFRQM